MEMALTPTTSSPGSWWYSGDRELECFPHQSPIQATKVHYGARPDLRSMMIILPT